MSWQQAGLVLLGVLSAFVGIPIIVMALAESREILPPPDPRSKRNSVESVP